MWRNFKQIKRYVSHVPDHISLRVEFERGKERWNIMHMGKEFTLIKRYVPHVPDQIIDRVKYEGGS